jgi:hypothetical protein
MFPASAILDVTWEDMVYSCNLGETTSTTTEPCPSTAIELLRFDTQLMSGYPATLSRSGRE